MGEFKSDDPRKAKTLGEAALNPDGKTYNGAKAISWLSAILSKDGKGLSEQEVRDIWTDVKTRKAAVCPNCGNRQCRC